jgi:chromosome segregation ATPase
MAMPALLLESEDPLEERIARLEANVDYIRSDISDMKIDIRRLGDKIDNIDHSLSARIDNGDQSLYAKIDSVDQKLSAKIDSVDQRLSTKIDNMDQKLSTKMDSLVEALAELRIGRALDRVWWLLMSGALLGIMARAFKWI